MWNKLNKELFRCIVGSLLELQVNIARVVGQCETTRVADARKPRGDFSAEDKDLSLTLIRPEASCIENTN